MDFNVEPAVPVCSPVVGVRLRSSPLRICRLSAHSEAEILLPLVQAWHAESTFRHLSFSVRKFDEHVDAALRRKDRGAAFYVVRGMDAIGIMELAVGEAWLSEGGCYATCLGWFVHPRSRRSLLGGKVASILIAEGTAWAKSQGASELFIHGTNGEAAGLERRGKGMGRNVAILL